MMTRTLTHVTEFGNMTRGQNSSILLAINMYPHDKNQLVV